MNFSVREVLDMECLCPFVPSFWAFGVCGVGYIDFGVGVYFAKNIVGVFEGTRWTRIKLSYGRGLDLVYLGCCLLVLSCRAVWILVIVVNYVISSMRSGMIAP